jgi:competence protein ComEA
VKLLVRTLRNFFGTTRSQTNGFIMLFLILVVGIFSQPVMRWWESSLPRDFTADKAELDSLLAIWETEKEIEPTTPEKLPITYFAFNPNAASKDELIALGFPDKLASRILNYRTKGGKFKVKADLRKIYGMDSLLYTAIAPHILLPDKIEYPKSEKKTFADREKPVKEKPVAFNLNEADTIQLQKIYGIGSVLAKRIIKYRDRLGGFFAHAQLTEVHGLDSTVIKKITTASYLPYPVMVQTINLNTADENTLATHPYLSKNIARAIVTYRFQHGKFQSVNDLLHINLIDKRILAKVSPYLTVDH